jgi:hypothetical protein
VPNADSRARAEFAASGTGQAGNFVLEFPVDGRFMSIEWRGGPGWGLR